MFGTEIVSKVLYDELTGLAEVQANFAGKVVGLPVLPQAIALPGIAFYPEFSAYDIPIGSGAPINFERLRFVVKVMCAGTDTGPVRPAALAQLEHLHGLSLDIVDDGTNYQIIFEATGEVPLTTVVDRDQFYRQLGTVYSVEVIPGG